MTCGETETNGDQKSEDDEQRSQATRWVLSQSADHKPDAGSLLRIMSY